MSKEHYSPTISESQQASDLAAPEKQLFSLEAIREITKVKFPSENGAEVNAKVFDDKVEQAAIAIVKEVTTGHKAVILPLGHREPIPEEMTLVEYQLFRSDKDFNTIILSAKPRVHFGVIGEKRVGVRITNDVADAESPINEVTEELRRAFIEAGFPVSPQDIADQKPGK